MNRFKKLVLLLGVLSLLCSSIIVARAQDNTQAGQVIAEDQSKLSEEQVMLEDQSDFAVAQTDFDIQEVQAGSGIVDRLPPNIKPIAEEMKQLIQIYSGVSNVVDVIKALGLGLGLIKPENQRAEFQALHDHLDRVASAITWEMKKSFRDQYLGQLLSAVEAARIAREMNRTLAFDSPANESSRSAVFAAAGESAFTRVFSEEVTKGLWNKMIRQPPHPNDVVYDWRLGVPSLVQLIALRLQVIAAVEPNFKSSNYFDQELLHYRDALLHHYRQMELGIRCGSGLTDGEIVNRLPLVIRYKSRQLACADIYTGTAAYEKIPSTQRNFGDNVIRLRKEVWMRMPFFEIRSIIDTLYLYTTGESDLTQGKQRIPVEAAQQLCLEVQTGNPDTGTPIWIRDCNGSDAQKWIYDRQSSSIRNPVYDKCLDVQWGKPFAYTPVWIWDCNGFNAQKWTYDPKTRVLQNALGTVLAVQGKLEAETLIWTRGRDESSLGQQWHADVITPEIPLETGLHLYLPLVAR